MRCFEKAGKMMLLQITGGPKKYFSDQAYGLDFSYSGLDLC